VSNWPGKYVIGLTGNIATGKSVVCKMLEYLGAYTIDADALSHSAIAKGAPGYQKVIDTFGEWVLDENGNIDRARLGRHVFSDPQDLQQLESIIHPLVEYALDLLIRRTDQRVIVIEAIKLLESRLVEGCDTIWVTCAPEAVQKARLMQKRATTEQDALQRIHAQSPQDVKIAAANVIIQNAGSLDGTWKQVISAWKAIPPIQDTRPVSVDRFLVS
jgi:dephospho-CoA kinase